MNILALCSALNNTYIGIKFSGETFGEVIKSDKNYHSLYLISKLKSVLEEKNISLSDFDVITVNCGPGSFTGIRVALSVAKIIAGELDKPLVPLNTAEILLSCYNFDILVMDARRDMYFICSKDNIQLILKEKANEIDFSNKKILTDKNCKNDFKDAICFEDLDENITLYMLKLAEDKYLNETDKSKFNYLSVEANYIQTPPVF